MNPIAVIPKSTTHLFWRAVEAGAREGAKEAGVEMIWKGSLKEDDFAQQIQIVQQFVSEGVGGVVLAPIDETALRGPVAAAMKIGGITGWLRALSQTEAAGSPVSSHLFPELSAQLLAISPQAHWLEYQDWTAPILQRPLELKDGFALPQTEAGCGLVWDKDAVERYRLR